MAQIDRQIASGAQRQFRETKPSASQTMIRAVIDTNVVVSGAAVQISTMYVGGK
jgi:hypothetical protein